MLWSSINLHLFLNVLKVVLACSLLSIAFYLWE